jgi:hypothetical protein
LTAGVLAIHPLGVPADVGSTRFDPLRSLLDSAQQLAHALASDRTLRRVLDSLGALPPDERETLAIAIERGVAWRKVNASASDAIGVRLRVNPNPRLFVRVVDGEQPTPPSAPDPDDVLVSIFRVLRLAPIVATDEARAVWGPAAEEALGMLSPDERRAALEVGRTALAMIERIIARVDQA